MPALTSFIRKLRSDGFAAMLGAVRDRLVVRWFEWRLGIRSESVIELKELGLSNKSYRAYVPTDYRSFRKILKQLRIRPGEDSFLDFGSGMGRAVIMAATHPFKKTWGVEIAPQLNEVARQNVKNALPHLMCRDIEIVTADATQFAIPATVTVIYFYNPFCGEVLEKVLANIRHSFKEHPRSLRLVCKIPPHSEFEDEIKTHEWLIRESEASFDGNSRYLFLRAQN